ncbi:MAG TPA: ATP-binding protein [Bauldia sp.]
MDGTFYPFLDLAALPLVGAMLLEPRAAFVFSADGARLLFANAAALPVFGEANIGELLDRQFSDLNPIKAQAARLARLVPTETARIEMLRFGQGVGLATLPAACRRLNLTDDTRAVLAIAANGGGSESLAARAERLVDAISSRDCLAALLSGDGKVLSASGGYDALAPAAAAIDDLVTAAAASADRIVKRTLTVAEGARDAGAVRFRAEGRDLVLLIVAPVRKASVAATPAISALETAPAQAPDAPAAPDASAATESFAGSEVPIEMLLPAPEAEEESIEAESIVRLVRFVFEINADGRFSFVSPELAATVGAGNGALAGWHWVDIASKLGAAADAVTRAIATGVGFSAILDWPAGEGAAMPVELTGLPRPKHAGFGGFGLVRPDEEKTGADVRPLGLDVTPSVAGPDVGPVLEAVAHEAEVDPPVTAEDDGADEAPAKTVEEPPSAPRPAPTPSVEDLDEAAQKSVERRSERSTVAHADTTPEVPHAHEVATSSNVVRLPGAPASRTPPERLTGTEREAFRRIAEALSRRRAEEAEAAMEMATPPPTAAPVEGTRSPVADVDTRLLDRLPLGIAIFRDHKTLFANRALLELLGYDSADAFFAAGGADAIFPGGEGLTGNIAAAGGSLAAKRRDGGTVRAKAWLHAVTFGGATALMLSLGAVERSDDADDALAEAMVRTEARAEELAAILDTATDGVIVMDNRGKIGSMNRSAEALFGVEASQYHGRYFTDLLADESQKAALDYLDGLASNGVASVLNDGREVIGRVPTGGLIPLFMTMGRIGTSDKFCAVLRDITHWKNIEEELIAARRSAEAANTQKSDFLAKISHEIRTPLNAIIGFSEVMVGESFGPIGNDRYRDYLRDIHVSGAHLMSLINDLLDLSKIEAGKLDLSFEAVPVNATIQECVALMQPQANRERIIIRTSLSADVPNVVADQRSFRQILLNVLSNAVKFTRSGGQVIVSSTLEENGEVVVRVRDTGIGMSEKDIETALKPFRQVATAREDREHGTGLGLPLTKALVEANRATFAIDSAPNQGTLVRITFPTTRVLAG